MVTVSLLLPQTGTAGSGEVAIVGHSVQGNVVLVDLENRGKGPKSVVLTVTVKLGNGVTVIGKKPASVPKGQSVVVPVGFIAPVNGVNEMKINQEHDPF